MSDREAKHRIEDGGVTVRALRNRCDTRRGIFSCALEAAHLGFHFMAYPGTEHIAYAIAPDGYPWHMIGAFRE